VAETLPNCEKSYINYSQSGVDAQSEIQIQYPSHAGLQEYSYPIIKGKEMQPDVSIYLVFYKE
jgi:hypothetical protein